MRKLLAAVGAMALMGCGPDLEEGVEGAAKTQALTEEIGGVPVVRETNPAKVEWVRPEEIKAAPEFKTFEEAYAYTVCSLGRCP